MIHVGIHIVNEINIQIRINPNFLFPKAILDGQMLPIVLEKIEKK